MLDRTFMKLSCEEIDSLWLIFMRFDQYFIFITKLQLPCKNVQVLKNPALVLKWTKHMFLESTVRNTRRNVNPACQRSNRCILWCYCSWVLTTMGARSKRKRRYCRKNKRIYPGIMVECPGRVLKKCFICRYIPLLLCMMSDNDGDAITAY